MSLKYPRLESSSHEASIIPFPGSKVPLSHTAATDGVTKMGKESEREGRGREYLSGAQDGTDSRAPGRRGYRIASLPPCPPPLQGDDEEVTHGSSTEVASNASAGSRNLSHRYLILK